MGTCVSGRKSPRVLPNRGLKWNGTLIFWLSQAGVWEEIEFFCKKNSIVKGFAVTELRNNQQVFLGNRQFFRFFFFCKIQKVCDVLQTKRSIGQVECAYNGEDCFSINTWYNILFYCFLPPLTLSPHVQLFVSVWFLVFYNNRRRNTNGNSFHFHPSWTLRYVTRKYKKKFIWFYRQRQTDNTNTVNECTEAKD